MSFRRFFIENIFYDTVFRGLNYSSVLEVGPGTGQMMDYFYSRGKEVTGMDKNPLREDVIKGDFLKNSVGIESHDLVYCAHVLEHVSDHYRFRDRILATSKQYVCVIAPLPNNHFWNEPSHIRPYTLRALKRLFMVDKPLVGFESRLPFFESVAFILFDKKDSRLVGRK